MLGNGNLLLIPDVKRAGQGMYVWTWREGYYQSQQTWDVYWEDWEGTLWKWRRTGFVCSCVCKSRHYSTLLRSSLRCMKSRNLPFPANAPNLLFLAWEALPLSKRTVQRHVTRFRFQFQSLLSSTWENSHCGKLGRLRSEAPTHFQ